MSTSTTFALGLACILLIMALCLALYLVPDRGFTQDVPNKREETQKLTENASDMGRREQV